MTTPNGMSRQGFMLLAALVVSSTHVLAGCGDDSTRVDPVQQDNSQANVVYVTASATQTEVAYVATSLSHDHVFVALHTDSEVPAASPTLIMDLPTSPGDHTLSELNAMLTVPGTDEPVALDGVLTVREVAAPCGTGACGRLTADLTLTPTTAATHTALTGSMSLSYSEEVVTESSGGGGGGGCGQQGANNPWGGWKENG